MQHETRKKNCFPLDRPLTYLLAFESYPTKTLMHATTISSKLAVNAVLVVIILNASQSQPSLIFYAKSSSSVLRTAINKNTGK